MGGAGPPAYGRWHGGQSRLSRQGHRTVLVDADPQADLTTRLLVEDELDELWSSAWSVPTTVARCLAPVGSSERSPEMPHLRRVEDRLWLLPGELALARFEQQLAEAWVGAAGTPDEPALEVSLALDRLVEQAASAAAADVVLVDLGPGLGALNRAALLACDAMVVPLAPDLFSLQGLEAMGPALDTWRSDARSPRPSRAQAPRASPAHDFKPMGYIIQRHLARIERPTLDFPKWAERVPSTYRRCVLGESGLAPRSFEEDEHCLFALRHAASLAPIALGLR